MSFDETLNLPRLKLQRTEQQQEEEEERKVQEENDYIQDPKIAMVIRNKNDGEKDYEYEGKEEEGHLNTYMIEQTGESSGKWKLKEIDETNGGVKNVETIEVEMELSKQDVKLEN